jgi:putative AlgH/UPF0301 family transcriptional regulator
MRAMLKLQAHALIASPSHPNPDCTKSVWVVWEHSSEVSSVFCLTKAIEDEVELDIRRRYSSLPDHLALLRGGHLDGYDKHIFILHKPPLKLSPALKLAPKFSVSVDIHHLKDLQLESVSHAKLVIGLEAWDPQELEDEIRLGLWNVVHIQDIAGIFFKTTAQDLWQRLQLQ